ncbi:MAG TPA: hypothetical protein VEW26_01300 [Allosphingosinicella sp.]|nr:hypothetical protein [Allosphingosinicella sp.]
MVRRLPLVVGAVAALATLLLIGPVALAVALLRSSPDAQGPALAAQLVIALLAVAVSALAGAAAWGLTHLLLRLFRRR